MYRGAMEPTWTSEGYPWGGTKKLKSQLCPLVFLLAALMISKISFQRPGYSSGGGHVENFSRPSLMASKGKILLSQ